MKGLYNGYFDTGLLGGWEIGIKRVWKHNKNGKWEMGSGNKIPEKIKRLFWDVDKEAVDLNLHRSYIIRRIIDYGNMKDVQWMLKSYSPEDIVWVVKKSRGLFHRSAWFWVHYFRIPPEEVECLKTSFTQTQKKY